MAATPPSPPSPPSKIISSSTPPASTLSPVSPRTASSATGPGMAGRLQIQAGRGPTEYMDFFELRRHVARGVEKRHIKKKPGAGGEKINYVSGSYVLSRLNEIFGMDMWDYQILSGRTNYTQEKKKSGTARSCSRWSTQCTFGSQSKCASQTGPFAPLYRDGAGTGLLFLLLFLIIAITRHTTFCTAYHGGCIRWILY